MLRNLACLISLLFFLANCGSKNHRPQEPSAASASLRPNSKAQTLNNIRIHESGGLLVTRSFLTDENGNLVKAGNVVAEGEAVFLNLVIKEGWIAEKGKVSIGATQTITTEDGEPVLSSPDLFAGTAIPEDRAGSLQLKTIITKTRPETKDFLVSFRVWDKLGAGELRGQYRLSLEENGAK